MSSAPSAHLFYGFVGEEGSEGASLWLPEDHELSEVVEWTDRWRTVTGFDELYQPPAEPYPEIKQRWELAPGEEAQELTPEQEAIQEAYSAYWRQQREWLNCYKPGCEISDYGCLTNGQTTPYVYVVDAEVTADWEKFDIDAGLFVVKTAWARTILRFCDKMGISLKDRKLGWNLVCSYG